MAVGRWRVLAGAAVLVAAAVGVVTAAPVAATTVDDVDTELEYRQALSDLSSDPNGPHTINITADIAITGTDDPEYSGTQALTIRGVPTGGGSITSIIGTHSRRILNVTSTAALRIEALGVLQGRASTNGGAINTLGAVTVNGVAFFGNSAPAGSGGLSTPAGR